MYAALLSANVLRINAQASSKRMTLTLRNAHFGVLASVEKKKLAWRVARTMTEQQ
jgi:hypothetical protein